MQGFLVFDARDGKFGISESVERFPHTLLEFGQEFEVKDGEKWVKTGLEIVTDNKGNLLFKLKNTDFQGELNGLEVKID